MNTPTDTGDGMDLTTTELAVVRLTSLGKSNAEIGQELDVTEDTVKAHLRRIGNRTGHREREAIVAAALEEGLLELCPPDPAAPPPLVTGRRFQVLNLLAAGLNTAAITSKLYITEDTLKTHVRKLFKTFEVHNRAHLIRRAYDTRVLKRKAATDAAHRAEVKA